MKTKLLKTQNECDPKEIALKSFFLGPQAENASWVSDLLLNSFNQWVTWRKSLFADDGSAISANDLKTPEFIVRQQKIKSTVDELLDRFSHELPKYSPRYLGHMFSEVSLPALLGHIVTLLHNPNNISGESSRVGINLEAEATQFLLKMVGYQQGAQGHFTSGGTLANFEGLVRARARSVLWLATAAASGRRQSLFQDAHMGWDRFSQFNPNESISDWNVDLDPWKASKNLESVYSTPYNGSVILIPENKHYSWKKGCQILGFGSNAFWPIQLDAFGRLNVKHLSTLIDQAALKNIPITMIVSVVGTTEMGSIDPVHEVQALIEQWKQKHGIHLWHHVDAAYGGFLCSMNQDSSTILSSQSAQALGAISQTQSITLDPHKLGYVPYASGAFLTRDPKDYFFNGASDAPYLDFDQLKDKGPFTIEGSRSAAGAVATWMTAKTMGLNSDGYGLLLERTFRLSKELIQKLENAELSLRVVPGLDSNLVCFMCARVGEKISVSNARTMNIYQAFSPKENGPFIVSKTVLNWNAYGDLLNHWTSQWSADKDVEEVLLIRMSVMNPFLGSKQMNVNFLELFIDELKKALE